MRPAAVAVSLFLGAIATNSMAEVTSAGPGGFTLQHEVTIDAERVDAWHAAVNDIGQWWSDDHTISGRAAAMTIDARPMGCFCEALANNGGVVLDGAAAILGGTAVNNSGLIPYADLQLSTRVFFAALGLSLMFAMLSGAYPAWRMSRLHPVEALHGRAR